METIELFSARICPFAHRSRLALREKGLPFELVEIDLHHKPVWFQEVNPAGAVPALRQGSFHLRESLIINEYINELAPEPPLLPATAQKRAEARLWIDFAASKFVPLFYRLLKSQDEALQSSTRDELLGALSTLNEELGKRQASGPYWFGQQISLTDIAFYPWFERWPVLEHYRHQAIPGELKALHSWIETMQHRDTVRQEAGVASFYIAAYEDYANGRK